jgi:hypothetical protein
VADADVFSNPVTIEGTDEDFVEYDDQAWVAAANGIIAELARTNGLLQDGIAAAEGSRIAMERMSSTMEAFLQQQREFQALLIEEIRTGFRLSVSAGSDKDGAGEEIGEEVADENGGEMADGTGEEMADGTGEETGGAGGEMETGA